VFVSDPWAAGHGGTLALNLTASTGSLSMKDANGNLVAGSGTGSIQVNGSLAQINADLAHLSYKAGTASGSITVDIWDQAGVEATKSVGATVNAPVRPTIQTISIAPNAANVTENVSGAVITASSGNHMIFIGGSGNILTATGGSENIQAFLGGNTITTGAGNDTIRFGSDGNTIDAGAGSNTLQDSGSNNTIVLPAANQGFDDIFGFVMMNGDHFDLRPALAATNWNGNSDTLGNFVKVTSSGNSAVISIDATGVAGGATVAIAKLEGSGAQSLSTLLTHAIT